MRHTISAFSFFATLSCVAHAQTIYPMSVEELKARYEEAILRRDGDGAWRLFCQTSTSDDIISMYRRSVANTLYLPVTSVAISPLKPSSSSTPESVEPIGRLVFTYDTAQQEEPKIASSFFRYGKTKGGYCLALPVVQPES